MSGKKSGAKNVFILGIGSDIGKALAERYLEDGYNVEGTYRNKDNVKGMLYKRDIRLLRCDMEIKSSIEACVNRYGACGHKSWDIFISCIGSMEPIGKFFECDFDLWERSVTVNSISQLRFLHKIYPYKRKSKTCHAIFFAGAGTNGPFTNYSAYCVSKIMLIKVCELLDNENSDLNVFIIGPGVVKTKMLVQTINNRAKAGANYKRTKEILKSNKLSTNYNDIYDCINWAIGQGSYVVGGRNISVVYDRWKDKGAKIAKQLRSNPDKFKLRRLS